MKDLGDFVRELETSIINRASKIALKRKVKLMHKVTILVAHEVACAAKKSSVISGSALDYTVIRTEVEASPQRRV
jgi:hypothetical protein